MGLILGQAIGRWGNFFNSEAFGIPTDLPWKLFIPLSKRPEIFISAEYFHPTFLYESIINLIIFFALLYLYKLKKAEKPGTIFFLYLILYSLGRLFVENLRLDSVLNLYGIPVAIFVSLLLILIGITGLIKVNRVS